VGGEKQRKKAGCLVKRMMDGWFVRKTEKVVNK
jgi:hypothetical protein